MLPLTQLLNDDNETIGYFSDHVAEMAARSEWEYHYAHPKQPISCAAYRNLHAKCSAIDTSIMPLVLEVIKPGDDDRLDYLFFEMSVPALNERSLWLADRMRSWFSMGSVSVDVQWFLVNRYRRPGRSNRDIDLGGPDEVVGVLYVLRIKAPK